MRRKRGDIREGGAGVNVAACASELWEATHAGATGLFSYQAVETIMSSPNTKGREKNAAQPLGNHDGASSKSGAKKTAEAETKSAGPDGPSAKAVGDTFKK